MKYARGYTLIELIVAMGLFALVMTLASGAYLVMIGVNRQAQALATGINNLSFAFESMTRDIRTGTQYSCGGGGDCSGGTSFSILDTSGQTIVYGSSSSSSVCGGVTTGCITRTKNGVTSPLTDPSVKVSSLKFYAYGTAPYSSGQDVNQARVTIIVSGSVDVGSGRPPQLFTIETGATMRGSDL